MLQLVLILLRNIPQSLEQCLLSFSTNKGEESRTLTSSELPLIDGSVVQAASSGNQPLLPPNLKHANTQKVQISHVYTVQHKIMAG